MAKSKRYLIIQKGRLGWYWRLQTAMPPKVGDKIANCAGQPYDNKKFCEKMAMSIVSGNFELIIEKKGLNVYKVTTT